MSQVNKRAKPTWDNQPNRIRGNKLQSTAWESGELILSGLIETAIAVFGFLAGLIGAICNFIVKNNKGIMDFCYNVAAVSATLFALVSPSKGTPKINNRKPRRRNK